MKRKLTPEQAMEVRRLRGLGLTYLNIAGKFGVSENGISRICRFGDRPTKPPRKHAPRAKVWERNCNMCGHHYRGHTRLLCNACYKG